MIFVGERVFACSGVLIDCHESYSRTLTSGSLVQTADKIESSCSRFARSFEMLLILTISFMADSSMASK